MSTTPTVPVTVDTLRVPGTRLHYELRGQGPLVVLVGSPMDATAFAPLADLLAGDHTVLTTDPRGSNRSRVDDLERDSTPELRADDLSRLLRHLDVGPAAVFGSSGGAVTALALAQAHPEQVTTVIAHEPPLIELLDDRDQQHAQTDDIAATALRGDVVGAWAKFLAQANIFLPDELFQEFFGGEREPQRAADERWWFAHELRGTTRWRPDIPSLRALPARIVVGLGSDSAGQLCDRTSNALAAALGGAVTTFPGDHTGFVDHPAAFAPLLRTILGEG